MRGLARAVARAARGQGGAGAEGEVRTTGMPSEAWGGRSTSYAADVFRRDGCEHATPSSALSSVERRILFLAAAAAARKFDAAAGLDLIRCARLPALA